MHDITELPAWERLFKKIVWEQGLTISVVWGIRTFWDLQQNQEKHDDEDWQKKMLQQEMRVAQISAYRNVAFFHHLILQKRNSNS